MYWKIENNKVVEFYRQLPKVILNTSLWKNTAKQSAWLLLPNLPTDDNRLSNYIKTNNN